MGRREFITLFGSAALAWPLEARAQLPTIPIIGYLSPVSSNEYAGPLAQFHRGLGEIGYVEGKNLTIEYRWGEGHYDRLPALAADLANRRVAVIVATSETSADAAKAATATIPIVFSSAIDPVSRGLVASLNRPGGNLTGITRLNTELESKRLELLHEVVPNATFFGLLVNPTSSVAEPIINQVQIAARSLGLGIQVVRASSDREIEVAFATVAELRADALLIASNTFLNGRSEKLAALAARHAIPAISQMREFAVGGGLMSYGSSLADAYRLIGLYVGRVLNGEKPSELPVQQVTKVEMLINLQCAKKLGLTFPLALLGRADEVIE